MSESNTKNRHENNSDEDNLVKRITVIIMIKQKYSQWNNHENAYRDKLIDGNTYY